MLTARWLAPLVAASFLGAAVPAAADPKSPPVVVTGDNQAGSITTVVTTHGTGPAHGGVAGGGKSGPASTVTCTWTEEPEYEQSLWNWVGLLGEPGGTFYDIRCSDDTVEYAVYVPPAAPAAPAASNVPPAVALAGALARQAVNRLPLPSPKAAHNPSGDALVNLATWWWVEPAQWQVLRQRTAVGPVWAQVTAEPVRSVWDAGDGTPPLVCTGPGQPYDQSKSAASQSTSCSSTYTRSSAGQPQTGPDPNDRFFTVTLTVYWAVSWTGSAGSGGRLPEISRTSSFPLRVAERQTIVTGGSG